MYRNTYAKYAKSCLLALLVLGAWLTVLSRTTASANLLDLKKHPGQVVYVDFWASWCGPCRASFPFMNAMHQKYADAGLTIIGVNVDTDQTEAQRFLTKIPADFAIHYDATGVSATEFGVAGMPHSFLFDQDGNLLVQHKGFTENDKAAIETTIRIALGLEPLGN